MRIHRSVSGNAPVCDGTEGILCGLGAKHANTPAILGREVLGSGLIGTRMNIVVQPLVSIVVPAYNEAKHIRECIESLLAQTYQNWECIIANNSSTDGSGEIARQYTAKDSRVQVYDNEHFLRAVPNFNQALRRMSPVS